MIELKSINKIYNLEKGKVEALNNIDITINRGEYISIIGPSSAGKTTLMNILGFLDYPTSGQYILEDYNITTLSDRDLSKIRNKYFGFIFQKFNLIPELTALENVMLPLNYSGVSFTERRSRAKDLLNEVGLSHKLQSLPLLMSGAEQQKVSVARALANDPDLIIADEPTGNLPAESANEIIEILESLNKRGVTIVILTNNTNQGSRAKRTIFMHDGFISEK